MLPLLTMGSAMPTVPAEPPPAQIGFQFESNAQFLRCVLVKPGKLYNVSTSAWEDVPASGNPADAHKLTPSQFFGAGVLATVWNLAIPVPLEDLQGGGILIYNSDAAGGLLSKLRYAGAEYIRDGGTVIYAEGGTFYTR